MPESDPVEGGRGYTIEVKGSNLFMATYLYDPSGRSTWYGAGPSAMNGTSFTAPLTSYSGGQTLTITYQVTINDGNGGTAVQNVVVTVTGTDDAFVIAPNTVLVLQGDTLPYPLIENDGTIQVGSNNQ